MDTSVYSEKFYLDGKRGSQQSAEVVLPTVVEIFNPQSIIDVGCGIGTWLSVGSKLGIKDFVGLDFNSVDPNLFLIPTTHFQRVDLASPVQLLRKFDLVMSLEVAEHLLESQAETFIQNLCDLGDLVLFSAAAPLQFGDQHINEQWPSYWIEKFSRRGFQAFDFLRPLFWENPEVEWWYRQNMLIFVRAERMDLLTKASGHSKQSFCLHSVVHPEKALVDARVRKEWESLPNWWRRISMLYLRLFTKGGG